MNRHDNPAITYPESRPVKLATLFLFLNCVVSYAAEVPGDFLGRKIHPDAAAEVHFWGALLGNWDVRWEAYDEDGNKRNEGTASWYWYSTLGGFALQDFFTHPMPAEPGRNRVGANLRVFDAEQKKWFIKWAHNFGNGFEEFTAVQDGQQIVMFEVGKEAQSRVRFFDFTAWSFRQQEEKSTDGGKSWQPSFSAWMSRSADAGTAPGF